MMEALNSSDTPVLIRAARRNFPEDGILHNSCVLQAQARHNLDRQWQKWSIVVIIRISELILLTHEDIRRRQCKLITL
jgi:hypothetical protein